MNGGQENQINAASSDTEQGSGGSSDVTQLETKNQKLEVEVQALKQQINALQNASASRAMMPSTQARET